MPDAAPARHRRARVTLLTATALLAWAAPAGAHPSGDEPTAFLTAQGAQVEISWRAERHDLIELAVALGLVDPARIDWDWAGAENVEAAVAGAHRLEDAPALHAYLLQNITVHQDGVACRGEVRPAGSLLANGARVVQHCPADVRDVTVRLSMLHDLHQEYRTVAQAPGDARPRVFTASRPQHHWNLGSAAATGWGPARRLRQVLPVLALLGLAVAVGRAALVQRRRRLAV